MTENINWNHFPHPYNQELPYYIGLAYQRLTLGGVAILDRVELRKTLLSRSLRTLGHTRDILLNMTSPSRR